MSRVVFEQAIWNPFWHAFEPGTLPRDALGLGTRLQAEPPPKNLRFRTSFGARFETALYVFTTSAFPMFLDLPFTTLLLPGAPRRLDFEAHWAPNPTCFRNIWKSEHCIIAREGPPKSSFAGSVFQYALSFADACHRHLRYVLSISCIIHIQFNLWNHLAFILDQHF